MNRDHPRRAGCASSLIRAVLLVLAACGCGSGSGSEKSEPRPLSAGEEKARDVGLEMNRLAEQCEQGRRFETLNGQFERGPTVLSTCQRACDLSHSNSCARAGELLLVSDAYSAAARLRQACDGGSGIGCQALAAMHLHQRLPGMELGDADDLLARARRYHEVHCGQGFAPSCAALAGLWQRGEGGAASAATAAHWQGMACRLEPATCDGAGRR